jgi:hypothetical protein
MRWPWQSQLGPAEQLFRAAGGDRRSIGGGDTALCQAAAFRAAERSASTAEPTLAVAENLLEQAANYHEVVSFLEDLQNVTSHGMSRFYSQTEISAWLGPRSATCWASLTAFWQDVANWCEANSVQMQNSEEILTVENEDLRQLLWTTNRSLPSGLRVNLAAALSYELAGGTPMRGYDQLGDAPRS